MNYSLRTLLLVAAGLSVVCASLAYPSPIVGDLFYTFGLLTIAFGTIAALYFRGTRRAFWVGFLILFTGYFCHSVWPGEIRSILAVVQRSNRASSAAQGLVTARLLTSAYEGLHPSSASVRAPRMPGMPGMPGMSSFPMTDETVGQFIAFMTVGHTAFALLLGVAGGLLAQAIASKTLPLVKRPLEKILSDMDIQ